MDTQQAFFKAVQAGEVAAVQQFLASDPDLIHGKNENGVTPLLLAIYYGQQNVVDALLAHNGETDIFEAAALGQTTRVVDWLDRDHRLLDAFADDGFMPLGLAAFFGHPDTVGALLRAGADPDLQARNAMQVRSIHAAVANQDAQISLEIARLLIEHGAELNVTQAGGWTPLHGAAMQGQSEVVHLLLAHGADKAAVSDEGKTAAQLAADHGHTELAEQLR